ncbi:CsbD family protein [Dendronalium sp. ChiSLP03b]|uniref:CsbD family protein n=1 Tax=Dendronalium sp. ChiSLP03b TaxID=3075381 RepID=UPI0026D19EEB
MSLKNYCLSFFCGLIAFISVWSGAFCNGDLVAIATPLENNYSLIAFHNTLGAGTSDKVEGKAKQALGSAQRNLGKVTGQAEGTAKQAEGKAKEDIGTTKNVVKETYNNVEKSTEKAIDNVKSLFGN